MKGSTSRTGAGDESSRAQSDWPISDMELMDREDSVDAYEEGALIIASGDASQKALYSS